MFFISLSVRTRIGFKTLGVATAMFGNQAVSLDRVKTESITLLGEIPSSLHPGMTIGGIVAGKLVDHNYAKTAVKHGIDPSIKTKAKGSDLTDFLIEAVRYR